MIQRSAVRCRGTWTLRRIGAQPNSALPRPSPRSSILLQAARTRSGSSSTASRQFFSRAGRQSERARRCRKPRTGRACWSYVANLLTACSPTAIFVRGIAVWTEWRAPSSAHASSAPVHGQLAFPSHRRGAVLSRHAGFGYDLFHVLQHAVCFCQNGDISTDKDNGEETDP